MIVLRMSMVAPRKCQRAWPSSRGDTPTLRTVGAVANGLDHGWVRSRRGGPMKKKRTTAYTGVGSCPTTRHRFAIRGGDRCRSASECGPGLAACRTMTRQVRSFMTIASATLAELKRRARDAATRAYAPYSRFPVGAAVLAADGTIHAGANVENASYGLSICAERAAIFQAVAQGTRQIEAIVIYTPTPAATAPCGARRQVIHQV